MDQANHHRVLMVEFVNADQFPGRINAMCPFLRGFLVEHGIPSRWIRYALRTTNLLEHGRDEVTLDDEEMAVLERAVGELRPTVILSDSAIYEAQIERLRELVPGVAVRDMRDRTCVNLPGLPRFHGRRELERPEFRPLYDWEPGNAAVAKRDHDNIYLAMNGRCGHLRRIANNPRFAEVLQDERVKLARGCSFCGNWSEHDDGKLVHGEDWEMALTPRDWISRQIEGIASSRGTPERYPNALLLEMVESAAVLEQSMESLEVSGMGGHVQLLMAVRTDQVPRVERTLRGHFERYPESKVRFGVYASGVESFDAKDLELFNKGTTPLNGLRAINTFRDLAADFPNNFWYTGVTFILHSPWVTPEGLHLNLGLIRRIGLTRKEAGNLFQARMRLHPDLPITCLAERERLVLDKDPDPKARMGRRKLFENEKPWRTVDERMGPLMQVFSRFELLETNLADEITQQIEERLRTVTRPMDSIADVDLVDFLMEIIRIVRDSWQVLDPLTLLDRAIIKLRSDIKALAVAPPRRRFRLGDELLALDELLDRLVPLVYSSEKLVLTIDDVVPGDLDPTMTSPLSKRGLAIDIVDGPESSTRAGTLLIGRTAEDLRHYLMLRHVIEHPEDGEQKRAAVREAGAMHGYPECCVEAFTDSPFADVRLGVVPAWAKRFDEPGPVPTAIDPLRVPALSFVPCSPDCQAAGEHYAHLFETVGCEPRSEEEHREVALLFPFDCRGDGALVPLKVAAHDDEGLSYDPSALPEGDDPALVALRKGDRLNMVPGQLRVFRRGKLVDFITASHGLFFGERCWHPDEWREIAKAMAWVVRTGRGYTRTRPADYTEQGEYGVGDHRRINTPFVEWAESLIPAAAQLLTEHTGIVIDEALPYQNNLRVWLRRGSRVHLSVLVEDAREVPRAFKRGAYFSLSHAPETVPDTREKKASIAAFLAALERIADASGGYPD